MANHWRKTGSRGILGWVLALLATATSAHAQGGSPTPLNYFTGMVSTTLAHRPPGGPFDGFQNDASPMVGYGRYLTSTIAVELDLGPTYLKGEYASLSLMPGLVFAFSPNVYAAARFILPVDPESNLALAPGLGAIYALPHGISPFVEVDAVSYVGRGDPDFGVSLTVGLLVSF